MKRKGTIGRLAAVAVTLSLITMSLTAGTLAKYASEVSGTANAVVAKWAIAFKDGEGNAYSDENKLALNLQDTALADGMVATGKIAPGTKGGFALQVDGTGTEVAFKYTIELDMSGEEIKKAPVKFYSNPECTTPLSVSDGKVTLNGEVELANVGTPVTSNVYWKWDSTNYDTAITEEDTRDTAVGVASAAETNGLVYEIPVKIHAEQTVTPKTGA